MLVFFYIVSVVAGLLAAIFLEKERIGLWFLTAAVAIVTGLAFCLPMFDKIMFSIDEPSFRDIFAVLSIIAWQLAMIPGSWWNVVNYEFGFALLALTILLFCSTPEPSKTLVTCNTSHVSTEIVPILTSTNNHNSTYGDGFIIEKVVNSVYSTKHVYKYFYQREDGVSCEGETPVKFTEIHFIDANESPYLEIITTRRCSGYDPELGEHYLRSEEKLYKLYVPEGSILAVFQDS